MRAARPVQLTAHYDQGPRWLMLTVVVLWRCEGCGKWSHAKRRPRSHERFIPEGEPWRTGSLIRPVPSTGPDDEGGYMVRCGPFGQWIAGKSDSGPA